MRIGHRQSDRRLFVLHFETFSKDYPKKAEKPKGLCYLIEQSFFGHSINTKLESDTVTLTLLSCTLQLFIWTQGRAKGGTPPTNVGGPGPEKAREGAPELRK